MYTQLKLKKTAQNKIKGDAPNIFQKNVLYLERQNFCAKIVQNTLVCSYSLNMFRL